MTIHRIWQSYGLANAREDRRPDLDGATHADLAGVFRSPAASAVVFGLAGPTRRRSGSVRAVGRSVPRDELPDPIDAATELTEVLRAPRAKGSTGPGGTLSAGSLLVFLRELESRTPPGTRLDAIFDRPLESLGGRVAAWLDSHPRYRIYTSENSEAWSRSAEAWFRRWQNVRLDPDSFRGVREYRRAERMGRLDGPTRALPSTWTASPDLFRWPPRRTGAAAGTRRAGRGGGSRRAAPNHR